jgi:GNAT superfamily N-acetyltransferase
MKRTGIVIRPFLPEDQAEAKRLVLAGLAEHWGVLDPALNPDLNEIAASYADGLFLTAWEGARLVGTGAYIRRAGRSVEIKRMSVDKEARRCGLGRQILAELIRRARAEGCQKVILETTESWGEVVSFYLNYGFKITHSQDGDVYFALEVG